LQKRRTGKLCSILLCLSNNASPQLKIRLELGPIF
jgi:hypothetical protein